MRIMIAPDSFKGSLSAVLAADAISRGVHKIFPEADLIKMPVADGGEGTVQALVAATKGKLFSERVVGPLGNEVEAIWGVLGDGETAVLEMAEASGLLLVPKEKRNPCITTTYGTGQLIKAVLDKGIRKIIIGIGGSATNDGGVGMAQALGVKFLNVKQKELAFGGKALLDLAAIDLKGVDQRVVETDIIVGCDVKNPLYGEQGAAMIYARQKGATQSDIQLLDQALVQYAKIAKKYTGKDYSHEPGAGAAGGLGAGLLWFTGAKLQPGIALILEKMNFSSQIKAVDFIITGEGCTDGQTIYGKAPAGIAAIANQLNIPVVCLSGSLGKDYEQIFQHGFAAAESIVPKPLPVNVCMEKAEILLEQAAERICRLIKLGKNL